MWGKTGINCFVLITGYFMCTSKITVKKFIKLIFEVIFYKLIIYVIFIIFGINQFTFIGLVKALVPIGNIGTGFVSAFIVFFLFIPFINVLIQNINKRQHSLLLVLTLFVYTIWYMNPLFKVQYNYITWFIVLYFISSYIRLYPNKKYDKSKTFWFTMSILFIMLSIISVFILLNVEKFPYFFVEDSNAILALLTSISLFMFFKNINIEQNTLINKMGASTFGILLIHANSDVMRQFLWTDVLKNTIYINSPYCIMHAVLSVIGVFALCFIIDQLRIKYIETPFFNSKMFSRIELYLKQLF